MIEIQVDYFGRNVVVDVPDCSGASHNIIAAKAMAQAATELNLDHYRFISFVLPESLGCNFGGLGELLGRSTWNVGKSTGIPAGVIVHEWGHNLSLDHSLAMKCSVNNTPTQFASRELRDQGACPWVDPSGPYSIMGAGNDGAITFLERLQVGWMRAGEYQEVVQGTYTLNFDGAPALLMLKNSEGDLFAIEYGRAPTPTCWCGSYDRFTQQWIPGPFVNGVILHYVRKFMRDSYTPSGYQITSFVLDMNPSTPHVLDAVLRAGQSFVDPTGTLQIDVTSVSATSATVNVRGFPFRPSPPTGFVVTQQSTLGVIDVSWAPVVAHSPVTHYELQISTQSDFADGATTKFGIVGTTSAVAIPNAGYVKNYFVRVAALNAGGRSDFALADTFVNWRKPSASKIANESNIAKLGGSCTSVGARTTSGNTRLVCKKIGIKLVWKKG